MRILFLIGLLYSSAAFAQLSDADNEGKSELRIFNSRWSPTFYSLASVESDRFHDEGGRLGTYNYFSFHTFIGGPYRFSLRLPFTYGSAGTDDFNGSKPMAQEFLIQDTILEIRNPELTYVPWDIGVYWAGRVYLPVSKHSKLTGQITRFRNHFSLTKMFGPKIEVTAENRYYYTWHSKTAYSADFVDEYGFEVNDVAVLNKQHEIENWLHVLYRIKPKWSAGVTAITEDMYYHKSQANGNAQGEKYKPPQRLLHVGPTLKFPLNESVNFVATVSDVVNRSENLHELGQFRAKNVKYVLHSFVNF